MTVIIVNGLDENVPEAVATEIRWLRAERERLHNSLCERSAQLVDAERRALAHETPGEPK